jgi:hypothetical protein
VDHAAASVGDVLAPAALEEFDISEMSMSGQIMTIANGDKRSVGIPHSRLVGFTLGPVALTRAFRIVQT